MKTQIAIIFGILISLSLISALSIKDVDSTPKEIMPGETAEITLEIENTLGEEITNLNVKLDLSEIPFAPYQSSAEEFVEELSNGEDYAFDFEIIVLPETSAGIYKIPVIMEYLDSNQTPAEPKTGLISVVVNSEVELNTFFEDSVLIRGKENTFSIKIVNSGLADVRFSYISIREVVGITIISEQEQYIGDIDSDDFDTAEYTVYIGPEAASEITLPLTLEYRDATNKEFVEQKEITLKVYSLKEAQDLGLVKKPNFILPIVISLTIGGYVLYRFIRKRRKLKKRK